ncbi:MAG TPA: hypothetical protein VF610_09335 [Segetibacter sp.]|jgi:hypothetical protein
MTEDNLIQKQPGLNEQQLEMLRLFKKPMLKQDYDEIKRLIVQVLARNVDNEMDRLENEKGWTPDTYEQWGKEHIRASYNK